MNQTLYLKKDFFLNEGVKLHLSAADRDFWDQASLKRVKPLTQIRYSTAIAHRIAARSGQPATTIASQLKELILQQLVDLDPEYNGNPWQLIAETVTVEVLASGLLLFQIEPVGLATWLDYLLESLGPDSSILATTRFSPDPGWVSRVAGPLFTLQHSHARCGSILRLSHRQRSDYFNALDQSPQPWQWLSSPPMAWLPLLEEAPIARQWVSHLCTLLDALAEPTQALTRDSLLTLGLSLSQGFDGCYRAFPLGSIAPHPEKLQAFLGLTLITQRLLALLLEQGLGCPAPDQL